MLIDCAGGKPYCIVDVLADTLIYCIAMNCGSK